MAAQVHRLCNAADDATLPLHLEMLEDVSRATQDSKTSHSGALKTWHVQQGHATSKFPHPRMKVGMLARHKTSSWDEPTIQASARTSNRKKKHFRSRKQQTFKGEHKTCTGGNEANDEGQDGIRGRTLICRSPCSLSSGSRCQCSRSSKWTFLPKKILV